jgi:Ca2+-binding EF-hand superfamily protein
MAVSLILEEAAMKSAASRTVTFAVFMVFTHWAAAQAPKAHDEMSGPNTKDTVEAQLRIIDTNNDGKLSQSEHAAAARQEFQSMDANQDNRVSPSEMDEAKKPLKGQDASHAATRGETHTLSAAERIKAIDRNSDGLLSADEHAAGSRQTFATADVDKDGYISAMELKQAQALLTRPEGR